MRSLPSILFAIVIAGLGSAWLFFEEEIREFVGWPAEKEEIVDDGVDDSSDSRKSRVADASPVEETSKAVEPAKEEVIQRIVMQRYPDLPATPFSEKFPSIEKIPEVAFPDRVESTAGVSFFRKSGNALLAASRVRKGGWVRPEGISDEGGLLVSSLANQQMTATVPISETDLMAKVQESYEASLQRAQDRIREMREEDASELRSNSRLFRKWEDSPDVWSQTEPSPALMESLFQQIDSENFSIVGHYEMGRKRIQTSDRLGVYTVTVFLIEGTRKGFGPFLWRVQSLESFGAPVEWLGLPQ